MQKGVQIVLTLVNFKLRFSPYNKAERRLTLSLLNHQSGTMELLMILNNRIMHYCLPEDKSASSSFDSYGQ